MTRRDYLQDPAERRRGEDGERNEESEKDKWMMAGEELDRKRGIQRRERKRRRRNGMREDDGGGGDASSALCLKDGGRETCTRKACERGTCICMQNRTAFHPVHNVLLFNVQKRTNLTLVGKTANATRDCWIFTLALS